MEERWVDHSGLGPNVVSSIIVQETPTRGWEVWMSEKLRDDAGTFVPGGLRVLGFPGLQHYTVDTSGIPSDDCNEVAYNPLTDLFLSAHATRGAASVDVDIRTWKYYTKTQGIVSDLGSSIAVNSRGIVWPAGTVWFATQAGLSRIAPDGKTTNYVEGSGLPTTNVRKVYVATNDHVWLGFVEGGAAFVKR
jgi:hypothetical protein